MRPPAARQPKPALPVPKQLMVHCPENEALSRFLLEKWRSMMREPDGLSENNYLVFAKANRSICGAKEPIRSPNDLLKIKGVGPWIIKHMKEFFVESSQPEGNAVNLAESSHESPAKGKKTRGTKCYVPRKNSAAYAILITLYKEKINGKDFMMKQELIDAAEASGLSRDAIGPNKSKAKQSYGKDWYTGWSCMKTLLDKQLVQKWSNPAKYRITEEGEDTARDCLSRSGLDDSAGLLTITGAHTTAACHNSVPMHIPELVCGSPLRKNLSSCYGQVKSTNYYGEGPIFCDLDSEEPYRKNIPPKGMGSTTSCGPPDYSNSAPLSFRETYELKSSSTTDSAELAMPPRQPNQKFLEAYEVVFILDDREKFGCRSRKIAENIHSQIQLPVEVRKLPVGDGIWIARHRKDGKEYVLDFIIERKEVSDLDDSITDNRYRDQKFRLKRCGISKVIYLVEGDPNHADVSERTKTACFTTELLEGFDVQRTSGYADTVRRYGYLTHSIIKYYDANFSTVAKTPHVCSTYDEFKKKCCDLEKKTVSQIFALQLMQVPQVTEEAALDVVKLYPTPFLLAQAYSRLDGDTTAQKTLLKKKCEMVNAGASQNIFHLVWGDG
ncbi:hypothetical protein BS78_K139900 [Paspalum vaginatum]|uniref:Crossover junction endonuclease MUS81 n=1 Tax=Paspalum vaginatum TaxID=158149 RepID=A0A9W8CF57_9POAL|nr:hypothetical protein BS78_K139900 [Paspalum vaginatum]